MLRIRAPSRLHFGLMSLLAEGSAWPDRKGCPILPARRFGGVGLMIESPGLVLRVEPASDWSAEGPLAGRALETARCFAAAVEADAPGATNPQRLLIESAPCEHVGLGTGTQLALAVAQGLSLAWGRNY